jgi:predicted ATPase
MNNGLERVCVQGFCSLRDVELLPGPLTVLIGANGSGKSNLLKALKLAPMLRTQSLGLFVGEAGGAAAICHYGPKTTPAISLQLDFREDDHQNTYSAELGFAGGDRLLFLDESVGFHRDGTQSSSPKSLGAGHFESVLETARNDDLTAKSVYWWLTQLTFFHFHDTSIKSALRTHSRANDDRFLRSDGSNLAAFLARLDRSDDDAEQAAWLRINDLVRRIAPSVKKLTPTIHATISGNDTARLDWIDDRDMHFGVHQLSDGTLRAIALITALAQPTEQLPRFISIDEPELGLHPAAIGLIAGLARSVSHRCQVLFATQSTQFLDHFEPSEIVVVDRRDGATNVSRPDEAELASWLEDYSLSEVFDKGILGGRP